MSESKFNEMYKILTKLADYGFIESTQGVKNETIVMGYDSGISFTPIIPKEYLKKGYAKKIKDKFIEKGFTVELNRNNTAPIIYYKDEELLFDRCFR